MEDNLLAELSKALGHSARIKIIKMLLEAESCVCNQIVENIELSQSTVSQHLKVLKNVGLIKVENIGKHSCYRVDQDILKKYKILAVSL